MSETIRTLLEELRNGLAAIYGPRLAGLYLFGSYARQEPQADSDVDVLVVLDRLDGYSSELERTGQLVSDLSLKYGVSISRVLTSQQAWAQPQTPFLTAVGQEAVAV